MVNSKIEFRVVDAANYQDVLLAAAIMAAAAQHDDGPAKLVLTNIHVVMEGIQILGVTYLLGLVDDRPCCVVFGDSEAVDVACVPHFRESGIVEAGMKEMEAMLATA